ncbi:Chemotaxis histidine kinase [uncultured Defluviicoccus sp.]|uniref:histidine kinase n=1 Tax=metagenome TaxID=256318 RepID=A0A380T9F5_9ZZZZ|nr:Chemotaxis histidine kinase [uncultured Defluviicoccus sp.]
MDDIIRDFLSEANESIETLDRALVRFEREPADPDLLSEIFRVMHTIKGTCGFLGLTRLAAVAHAGENILGQFRDGVLRPTQESVSAVLDAVDLIKQLLVQLEADGAEPPGDDSALIRRLNGIADATTSAAPTPPAPAREPLAVRVGGLSSIDCAVEIALSRAKATSEGLRFHALQEDALHAAVRDAVWAAVSGDNSGTLTAALATLGAGAEAEMTLLISCIDKGLNELGLDEATVAETVSGIRGNQAAAKSPPPEAAPGGGSGGTSAVAAQTIRVQVEALEQLMNVASELVLIRNQLLQTLRSQPESPFAGPLQRLNHVTTELQESVMTTRMQPISAAWAKLPRLARDLAIELGKQIEITMSGAETELDRQVLEQIKDPLTHMIRNAADHGLETPGERARAGKPETGRILLSARHEGSHIVIEIGDDGRGLALSKIRAKALAQGLISPAEAETMSDAKIQNLIFHPGFSTAAAITGVSGRGVGMDVVRTNIEKIGGTVELASTEGRGTRFTIRIPLTLTIVSALIVDCCGEKFAVPQASVIELVGVGGGSGRAIETVNGTPVLRLRDRLLPLVSLQELMRLDPRTRDDERSILVTRVGAFSYGIIVDRVFDTEEIVVKPAASILRSIPFYSGATILGDGAVIMILDPKGIASCMGSIIAGEAEEVERGRPAGAGVQLLIVRGGGQELKATPLQLVSRIEDVAPTEVEFANGQAVMQYRGRLMPLVPLDPGVDVIRADARRPVVVFDDETRAIGIVVEEIVDIVESPLQQQFKPRAPGALGSLVVGGQVTDIIDIAHYWRSAAFDATVADQQQPAARRALVIDPSQFQRNLLSPLLAMAGFEVVMAEDPAAARAIIERGPAFDIILTDAWISESDLNAGGRTPVIGLYDDGAVQGAGAFSETASRFDRDGLLASIESALRQTRAAA